jgi:thioesterase-3
MKKEVPMGNTIEIKVRGYHLDGYGHVNNARYLEFLEEARWAMFEDKVDLVAWRSQGRSFFVVNINISYRKPAALGQVLQIRSFLSRLGKSSGVIRQEIYLKNSQILVTDADVTFAIADSRRGKALPLSGDLARELEVLKP